MSDPLAQIIELLRPRAVFAKGISGAGRWAVSYAAFGHPGFCAVIEGRCRLAVDGEKPAILEAKLDDTVVDPGIKLTLQVPQDGSIEDVFVEGPGMWSFGKTHLTPQADGLITAQIRINDRPKSASGPIPLIFTVRGTPKPVETRLELDIPTAKP